MITIKLYSPTSNISKYIAGLNNGFLQNGIISSIWCEDQKVPFDLFAEEKFDVLFIEEEHLKNNRALLKCLNKNQNIVVILKLPDHKEPNLELPLQLNNKIIYISAIEYEYKSIINLIRYGINPSLHYLVNSNDYYDGLVYIGEPTKYVNSILSQICNPVGVIDIKLFTPHNCNDAFPFSQYCGKLQSFEEEREIYSRAEYGLDITEPNISYIGEKIYEMMACGTEIITNNKMVENLVELEDLPPTIIADGFNLENFKYVSMPRPIDEMYSISYFDRAKEILELL